MSFTTSFLRKLFEPGPGKKGIKNVVVVDPFVIQEFIGFLPLFDNSVAGPLKV